MPDSHWVARGRIECRRAHCRRDGPRGRPTGKPSPPTTHGPSTQRQVVWAIKPRLPFACLVRTGRSVTHARPTCLAVPPANRVLDRVRQSI